MITAIVEPNSDVDAPLLINLIDWLVTDVPIANTTATGFTAAGTYDGQSYTATVTGTGFTYTTVNGFETLTGGIVDTVSYVRGGVTVVTITNVNIDMAIFAPIISTDLSGSDITAIERYLMSLDWDITLGNSNDTADATALVGDGVAFNMIGNDVIDGSGGNDVLFSGDGNDRFLGSVGSDSYDGGEGTDILDYEANATSGIVFNGATGATGGFAAGDTITNIEILTGGNFNDSITVGGDLTGALGKGGDDELTGDDADNTLDGGDDNDTLIGGAGNDLLLGGAGNDSLEGGEGDDRLFLGLGDDVAFGGAGNDDIVDTILSGDDEIHGGDGDDLITVGAGNNMIFGDAGNDELYLRSVGGGTLDGGAGIDTLRLESRNDGVTVDLSITGSQVFNNGSGVNGLTSVENLIATTFDDVLTGSSDDNEISGLDGDDEIDGGAGNDTLIGGAGEDTIHGGDGDDMITGGGNGDYLFGDAGDDTFYEATQIIGAFSSSYDGGEGEDTLVLDAVGNRIQNYSFRSADALVSVETVRVQDSTDIDASINLVFGARNMTMREILNDSTTDDVRIRVFMDSRDYVDLSAIAVTGDFADGIAVTGGFSGETIIGFGNRGAFYNGGNGSDTITGGALADRIEGDFGDDSLFGDSARSITTTSLEGQLFRAYQAVFGRSPDAGGFNAFLTEMRLGNLEQVDVIGQFVASAEFQNSYGQLDNTEFVEQLFTNVLPGNQDAQGRANYVAVLEAGTLTRPDMVVELSNSPEFINRMTVPSAAFATNVILHPAEAQVFRIYQAVFLRDPDEGGFTAFTNSIQANVLSVEEITAEFVASTEFQDSYGALDNAAFVELLFTNVLPGNTDAAGRAAYTAALDAGTLTRAAMVAEFVESFEFVQRTAADANAFVAGVFSASGDTLVGGTGADILFGGRGADLFVYDTSADGADTILDFTVGTDTLDLGSNAAFDSFAEIIAAATQVGQNTVFDFGGGNTLTLDNTVLTDLTEAEFGFGSASSSAAAKPPTIPVAEVMDEAAALDRLTAREEPDWAIDALI